MHQKIQVCIVGSSLHVDAATVGIVIVGTVAAGNKRPSDLLLCVLVHGLVVLEHVGDDLTVAAGHGHHGEAGREAEVLGLSARLLLRLHVGGVVRSGGGGACVVVKGLVGRGVGPGLNALVGRRSGAADAGLVVRRRGSPRPDPYLVRFVEHRRGQRRLVILKQRR